MKTLYRYTCQLVCCVFLLLLFPTVVFSQNESQTISLSPIKDSEIRQWGGDAGYASGNYGNNPHFSIQAYTVSGSASLRRSLMQFDLSSLPSNSEIVTAVLKLYAADDEYNWAIHSGANSSALYLIADSWGENTITWKNAPSYFGDGKIMLPKSSNYKQNYEVDISSFVNQWVSGEVPNNGLLMRSETEAPNQKLFFASSDATDPTKHPRLEITYKLKTSNISSDQNYIWEISPLVPMTTIPVEKKMGEALESVTYYDGLGRPMQQVQKQVSPLAYDLIAPIEYDGFGREATQFLPFASTEQREGGYVGEWKSEQKGFYDGKFGANSGDFAFTQSDFDGSPLNRVTAVYSPGKPWAKATDETGQPTGGEGRPVKTDYLTNTTEDGALFWELVDGELTHREYAVGTLYKTVATDENGHQSQEFKDLQGRMILKKVQASDTAWASTYYVYDDWGNLIYVLPPEAVNNYGSGGSRIVGPEGYYLVEDPVDYASVAGVSNGKIAYLPTASVTIKPNTTLSPGVHIFSSEGVVVEGGVDHWIFSYKYDERNRMVEKKVPGAKPLFMIYDKLDRLVLTQDGNQRKAGKWAFTKYDAFDRPVVTGEKVIAGTVEEIRNVVKNHTTLYETYTGSGVTKYSNTAYPASVSESDIYTITYYDNYRFTDKQYSLPSQLGSTDNGKVVPSPYYAVKGQVTGTKIKVLGTTNDYIETVNFYDDRYRLIQSKTLNHKDGNEVVSSQYDFAGRIRKTHMEHTNPTADISSTTVTQEYEYDHAGRLLSVNHSLNGAAPEILLSNTYNELGQLANKNLADGFEDIDYAYNIRGWLTGLNSIERGIGNFFGMDLYYDDAPTGHQNYNGNISSVLWSFGHSNFTQRYDYTYDPMDRLKAADYSGSGGSISKDFDVSGITYDLNGNIETLTRKGDDENKKSNVAIDKLTYSYAKGNQLSKVKDSSGKTAGFRDGTDQATEYLYDENGNMKEDRNKGITSISYNHLNLPQKVNFSSAKYIEYTYDASGTKLSQKTVNNGTSKVTDYLAEFIYEDNKLQFLHHDEGRVVIKRNDSEAFEGYEYQYYLKDHLGNIRATVRFEAESDTYLATLENDSRTKDYESTYFERYGEVTRINADLFDHTDAGSTKTYSMRLNGTGNEVYGLAKSLAVQPGDWVWASVFAKYLDPSTRGASGSSFAQLIRDLENNASHVVTDGATAGTNPSIPFAGMMGHGAADTGAPKAYLNILVFNEEDELVNFAYKQLSTSAAEDGSDVPHENIDVYTPIYEPGYVYIYLSNEAGSRVEVFFDDFRVTQAHGLFVQKEDFYPFGMSFNSYMRPGETDQKFKFNGKERDEVTGWDDFGARMYMPDLGRWGVVDPLADQREWLSPYNFVQNNPINRIDPDGAFDWVINGDNEVYWDENATSQATTKEGETYLGKSGTGVDEQTGNTLVYNSDGSIDQGVMTLGEVTVSATQSDHERTMSSPVVQNMRANSERIQSEAIPFARHMVRSAIDGAGYTGAGITAIGTVVTPFVPPLGVGLLAVGGTVSTASGLASAGMNLLEGNYGSAAVDVGMVGLGKAGTSGLKVLKNRGFINTTDETVLSSVYNSSVDILGIGIAPAVKKR